MSILQKVLSNLIDAALDQPKPTPELRAALNEYLTRTMHDVRDRTRDPAPSARKWG